MWGLGRESQFYTFDGNSWQPTSEMINPIAGGSLEQIEQMADKFHLLSTIDGVAFFQKLCKNVAWLK